MRNWKVLLGATIFGAGVILAIVHHDSNAADRIGGKAPVVRASIASAPSAFVTNPIVPSDGVSDQRPSGGEYGWGPVRNVDW